MARSIPFIILSLAITVHILTINPVREYRSNLRKTRPVLYLPPEGLINLLALDYKNILSTVMMFRATTYYGERIETRMLPDWNWLYKLMEASIDLDPYNIDTYYIAQAILPWEAGMSKETNKLLSKGLNKRTWDWFLPFSIAVNHFYFLGDNKSAADYFRKASKINPWISQIAAKYYQKAGDTKAGIIFLQVMLEQTKNVNLKKSIEKRMDSLNKVILLERAIESFLNETERFPDSIDELMSKRFIKKLPKDPFGYLYKIDKNGKVILYTPKKKRK